MSLKLIVNFDILSCMAVEEYNSMASYYDTVLEPVLWRLRKKIVQMSRIHTGTRVLEIACGTGIQAVRFKVAGADYIGIDLSPAMLLVAKKRGLECIHADGTRLAMEPDSFDVVTITLALHEVAPEIRKGIMEEMIRVCVPGGYLVVVDYTVNKKGGLYPALGKKTIHFIEKLVGGSHYRNYLKFMQNGGLEGFLGFFELEIEDKSFSAGGNIGIYRLLVKK